MPLPRFQTILAGAPPQSFATPANTARMREHALRYQGRERPSVTATQPRPVSGNSGPGLAFPDAWTRESAAGAIPRRLVFKEGLRPTNSSSADAREGSLSRILKVGGLTQPRARRIASCDQRGAFFDLSGNLPCSEDAENRAESRRHCRENPEPHRHFRLGPANRFEVVVDRRT